LLQMRSGFPHKIPDDIEPRCEEVLQVNLTMHHAVRRL